MIVAMNMSLLMKLMQFTDSALPVGTFSFSNGLETAASEGIVKDAATLNAYTLNMVRQTACSDGIAALQAHRAARENRYDLLTDADRRLLQFKMNDESRQMAQRMGKKLAELTVKIFDSPLTERWLKEINSGTTPGCYPVAQALAFATAGLDERELFCSMLYGTMSMILGAALRCVKVSHYDTQRILYKLGDMARDLYDEVCFLAFDDMNCFAPENDIVASMHEKGEMRMFMS